MNPLLDNFNTPFHTVPFSKIENKHFKPAFERRLSLQEKKLTLLLRILSHLLLQIL